MGHAASGWAHAYQDLGKLYYHWDICLVKVVAHIQHLWQFLRICGTRVSPRKPGWKYEVVDKKEKPSVCVCVCVRGVMTNMMDEWTLVLVKLGGGGNPDEGCDKLTSWGGLDHPVGYTISPLRTWHDQLNKNNRVDTQSIVYIPLTMAVICLQESLSHWLQSITVSGWFHFRSTTYLCGRFTSSLHRPETDVRDLLMITNSTVSLFLYAISTECTKEGEVVTAFLCRLHVRMFHLRNYWKHSRWNLVIWESVHWKCQVNLNVVISLR